MSQWFVFIHKETEAQGEGREEMEEQGLKSRSPQPPTLQAHGPQCLLLKNHLFNLPQIHETLFEKAHDHRIGTEKKKSIIIHPTEATSGKQREAMVHVRVRHYLFS